MLAQSFAVYKLGGDKVSAISLSNLVDCQNVWMIES
jgi:hypothetical protein